MTDPSPKEFFSIKEAAKRAGVTYRMADYWQRTRLVRPSSKVTEGVPGCGRGAVRKYSREDIVTLTVVGLLRAQGLPLQRVRRVVREIAKLKPEALHPLAETKLVVLDREVIVAHGEQGLISVLQAPGQSVLRLVVDLAMVTADIFSAPTPARRKRKEALAHR